MNQAVLLTKRILIVDDHPEGLYYLRVLLESAGYAVVAATQGEEALQVAREARPDLIISDILMPVMDGFSLCREWKSNVDLCRTPFVFYTATYTDERDRVFAVGLGADRFIEKPQEPEKLLEVIEEVLHERVPAKSVASSQSEADEKSEYLEEYNSVLIRKLEAKMEEMARLNRHLEDDLKIRRQMELALRENEQRYRTLVNSGRALIWVGNEDGCRIDFNEPWCEFTGLTREQGIAGAWKESIHSDDREFYLQRLHNALHCRCRYSIEFRLRHCSGHYCYVQEDGTPRFGEEGIFLGFIGQCFDTTERKELESRLLQSEKMEALGQLAAGVAHDFNNILAGIVAYADLLLLRIDSGTPAERHVDGILKACERGNALARRVLTFSRERGCIKSWIDLRAVVSEALEMAVAPFCASLDVNLKMDEHIPSVFADVNNIHEMVLNILTNAVYAMQGRGSLSVAVRAVHSTHDILCFAESLPAGDYVVTEIVDSGCGIDPQQLSRVFDPFFSTKPASDGCGLGLAVVAGILRCQCRPCKNPWTVMI